MFTTAWTSHDATKRGNKLHLTRDVVNSSFAELCAIVDFAKHVSLAQTETEEEGSHRYRVYTDSQEAYRACQNTRTTTVVVRQLRLHVSCLRALGHDFHVHWIPGHSGIPGNDRAHRLARALLLSAQSKPPERFSNQSTEDTETQNQWLDPAIMVASAKQHRRSYLRSVSNPLNIPPLPCKADTRWQQVTLRRVQTGTLLTPYLLQRFRSKQRRPSLDQPNTGMCSQCGTRADLEHLLWFCPLHSAPRARALASLPREMRPTSLQTWATPHPGTTAVVANELWRSLNQFLSDPEAPATGSRLGRLGHTARTAACHSRSQ